MNERLSAWQGVRLGGALFVAALIQSVFADALRIKGAGPDLLLLVALLGSLFCNVNGSAALGFSAGLLHAAMSAPPHGGFGSLIESRTLVCIGAGWLEERVFRDNVLIAIFLAAFGTALAEGLFFLFAPQPNVLLWARALGIATLYNTVLAGPLYFVIRKVARGRVRRTP
jgi:pheromone shutdown protein TraB